MIPKAIIFDMDGLLIDSEPLWRQAEVEAFNQVGVPLTERMCFETMGLRPDEVTAYWYERYPWHKISQPKVTETIVQQVLELIKTRGEALPGATHAINVARSLGCKVAIASTSSMAIINTVLKRIDIGSLDGCYSAEFEPHGKPHPGVYLAAAKGLGVDPTQCLAFEDSINGLIAAKAARMKCIAVPDALVRNRKELCVADMVIDSLEEVTVELIGGL